MKTKYIQPSVHVTNITLSSQVLVGSAGGSNTQSIHNNLTDDQW